MISILFGLVIGSFLNVLIWRLNVENAPKFWQGRSMCPHCKHQLAWNDNIPLLSFLLLRGRCRYCKKIISWQYPVVEALTAATLFFLGWQPLLWILAAAFIVIFFSDLFYGLIPDEMIIVGSLTTLIGQISQIGPIWLNLIVGLVSAGAFLLVVLVTKFKGMGLGDVKLAFLMGFLLGWPNVLVALWVAFISGGLVALILLSLKKAKLSATIALGPFLVFGIVVSALWSSVLLAIL